MLPTSSARADRDRYLADLFAPEAARPHLFALHAFNARLRGSATASSEPTLGEIRLQWWRDALARRCRRPPGGERAQARRSEILAAARRLRQPPRSAHVRPLRRPDAEPERPRGLCRRDLVGPHAARRHHPCRRRGSGDRRALRTRRRRLCVHAASCGLCRSMLRAGSAICRPTSSPPMGSIAKRSSPAASTPALAALLAELRAIVARAISTPRGG